MIKMKLMELTNMSPHSTFRGQTRVGFMKLDKEFSSEEFNALQVGVTMIVLTQKEYEELVGKLVTKE